jgi:hypothetical protein
MYSLVLSGPYASTQADEDSTYVDGSVRLEPEALSISTASDLQEGSIVMRYDSIQGDVWRMSRNEMLPNPVDRVGIP